jgi:molecular chaperone GrpE
MTIVCPMTDTTDPSPTTSEEEPTKASDKTGAGDPPPAAAEDSPAEADPLAAALAEASANKEKFLRTAADFDNFRKRARRDVEDAEKRAKENLLKDLLPVFDNLERAVAHAETAKDAKSVAEGVSMVLRQFIDSLARAGIERVKSTGESFDPNVHEAIQQLESDVAPGTILTEVQAGYRLGERLVRAAMVVVAKPKSS